MVACPSVYSLASHGLKLTVGKKGKLGGGIVEQLEPGIGVSLLPHLLDVSEGAIDAGEADIGYTIKLAQSLHHHVTNGGGGYLTSARFVELRLDVINQFLDSLMGYGTFGASLANPSD